MRVLIVGGSGMFGHRAALEFASAGGFDLHVTVRRAVPARFVAPGATYHEDVDLAGGSAAAARVLKDLAPDIVVNAVGAIKQRDLEAAVDESYFLNGALPHLLALLNPNPSGRVFHISTDCVFRGDKGAYTEVDQPDVQDLYGRSKAVGELGYGRHLTLRTSIVGFEIGGHLGLVSWFFSQPPASVLRGFTHARYSGLTTGMVSRLMVALAREADPPTGLWHVASEPITKFDLLARLSAAFDLGHRLVPDDRERIDRTLDDSRFRTRTGSRRPSWDELITDLRRDWERWPYAGLYASRRAATRNLP